MKRLMTMLTAVALAVGLHAVAEAAFPNGTSFESDTLGVVATNGTGGITLADSANATWTLEADDAAAIEVKEYVGGEQITGGSRPNQFSVDTQSKYLQVKTTLGKTLERKLPAEEPLTPGAQGYYVDTLVKFTACEEAPVVTNVLENKLAVWVLGVDADGTNPGSTNLMVTANAFDAAGNRTVTNFKCDIPASVNLANEGWHRLTIKGIADITDGNKVPGFVVFVDGGLVSINAASGGKAVTEGFYTLTPSARAFNNNGQLFVSLYTASTDIKGVALSGQGGIDDISFTQDLPFALAADKEFYQVTGGENITGFSIAGTNWTSGSLSLLLLDGSPVEVTGITAAPGWVVDNVTTTLTVAANGSYTIGSAKQAGFTVTIGGSSVSVLSFADAVSAANVGGQNATIALMRDYDGVTAEINNADFVTTIDLAGHSFTGGISAASALVITNSVAGQTGGLDNGRIVVANPLLEVAITMSGAAQLTVYGGYINGQISKGTVHGTVYGGQIYGEYHNDLDLDPVKPADGFIADNQTGYWTVRAAAIYTITYMDGETPLTLDPATYTEGKGTNLPATVTKEGFTFDGWYDNAGFTGDPIIAIASGVTGPKTFYAKFTATSQDVTTTSNIVVTASSTNDALAKVNVVSPNGTIVDNTTYAGYFTKTATDNANGTWSVDVALNPEVVEPDTAAADVGTKLAASKTSFENVPAKSGLWYQIVTADNVGFANPVAGAKAQAVAGAVTLTATLPVNQNSVFYKIVVTTGE